MGSYCVRPLQSRGGDSPSKKMAGTECFPPDPGTSVMTGFPVQSSFRSLFLCKQLHGGRPQIVHQVPSGGIGFFIVPGRLRDLQNPRIARSGRSP